MKKKLLIIALLIAAAAAVAYWYYQKQKKDSEVKDKEDAIDSNPDTKARVMQAAAQKGVSYAQMRNVIARQMVKAAA